MSRLIRLLQMFGAGRAIGLVLLVLFVSLRIWDPLPLEVLRLKTFDFYQVIQPRVDKPVPVTIIDIDEESLNAVGQWPWARTKMAELVNRVSALGGVVIGFDIIFAEPDRLSPGALADHYPSLDPVTRRRIAELPSNDLIFAHALRRFRAVAGLTAYNRALEHSEQTPLPSPPLGAVGGDSLHFFPAYPGAVRNLAEIEEAALGHGIITIKPEPDGIVRRAPAMLNVRGTLMPSLTVEMLRIATGGRALIVKRNEIGVTSIIVGGLEVPTDEHGQFWIHFSPHNRARYVSAKDVLDGTVDPAMVANRLLLVGTSAVGLQDIKSTPIDPIMPGVEVHAQILETMLTQSALSRPGKAVGAEVLMAIVVGLLVIGILPAFRAWVVLVFGCCIAFAMIWQSWFFYSEKHILIDVAYPLASSFAIYWAMIFFNYFREEVERRKIRSAFGQYISPSLVEELARNPEKLVLGGETKKMTILFSDVRGFTAISEQYKEDPQGLTLLMNRLLTPLSHAIIENDGTIDKYMGDAVMAFWNAPVDDAQHATDACVAAVSMLEKLEALNEERKIEAEEEGREFLPLNAGVGINTGDCVVGNMGSDMRFDYSVLGDAVNLASRLEGQSKSYGVPVIVGSATADLVKARFALVELDLIRVKGKQEPECIYTLFDRESARVNGADVDEMSKSVEELIALYRARNWSSATKLIKSLRDAAGHLGLDELLDLYAGRIAAFKKKPPPKGWDGVFVAETK